MASPKPSGLSNTKEGKRLIFERTRKLIDASQLIITLPIEGVTKEQTDILRKELPKTVKASVVKNAIMKKALQDTSFQSLADGMKNENMFFFIPEGDAKTAFTAYKKWAKEIKRTDPEVLPKNACLDGVMYPAAQVEAVANLPTKLELITKIAQGIKAVPTKVGRGINAVPNKLGRAFGALKKKLEDEA